ncbi:MAG: ABC transporter ATP-binding protein [Actinomycetota bacterium]|nr:ABC transporter ATP-binding protein [Actinomycetota bacterium]
MTRTGAPEAALCPVRARGLVKAYGRTVAVDGVDLEIQAGEVVGFLGPNGAGKTTVLRVLSGALRATAGQVTVLGRDPFREAARVHQQVGYLPGDLRLPTHLTGARVLDLCAAGRTDPGQDRARLVDELDVPLTVPVSDLSKGNRQKLGIVQALMSRPRLLLLDEPTSGLDPIAQQVLENLLRTAAARGAAVLLSSHILREVEQVAERVVMLRGGKVTAATTLRELRAAAPHDVRVDVEDPATAQRLGQVRGVRGLVTTGSTISCTVPTEGLSELLQVLAAGRVRDVSITPADLETLFRHYYQGT